MQEFVNYKGIDLAKIIASILVLSIHTNPLVDISPIASYILENGFARLAVPFFFTASGFLLFNKFNLAENRGEKKIILKKYLFRIAKLYLVWSIIYFPIILINWINNDIILIKDLILYTREIFILGTYGHLWYFPALICAIYIVYVIYEKYGCKILLYYSLILYSIGIFLNFYPYSNFYNIEIINKIYLLYMMFFSTTRNGMFFGVIFVTIGCLLANKKNIMLRLEYIVFAMISIILLIIESLIISKLNISNLPDMYIMLIPSIYFGFMIIMGLQNNFNKISSKLLRNLSTLIYTSQFVFILLFDEIFKNYHVNSLLRFIIILTSIIVVSILIIKASSKKKFIVSNYLY